MAASEAGVSHLSSSPAPGSASTPPGSSSTATGGSGRPGSHPAHGHANSLDWPREGHFPSVRYRGFVLIPQADLTWLIRPERSPMRILPFRAPASSLTDVKALVDWRLAQHDSH